MKEAGRGEEDGVRTDRVKEKTSSQVLRSSFCLDSIGLTRISKQSTKFDIHAPEAISSSSFASTSSASF